MEEQTNLENIGIGDKEVQTLKPAKVKIVKATVETVGEKGNRKVQCECQHPEKTDGNIRISSAQVLKNKTVTSSGLWFNLDEDERIRKGSTLALFLQYMGVSAVKELEGKEVDTEQDDKGYLSFKAY